MAPAETSPRIRLRRRSRRSDRGSSDPFLVGWRGNAQKLRVSEGLPAWPADLGRAVRGPARGLSTRAGMI